MVTLKDGTEVLDSRLDRIVLFDEESRKYPVRAMKSVKRKPRSYTWRLEAPYVIDQGNEGACVGFAITNELMARPSEVKFRDQSLAQDFARANIYWAAQREDPWPGGAYPGASPRMDGTAVLTGMKVARRLGYFKEFRWAFGLEDVVLGVGYVGPCVIGINWHHSMYRADENGFIWDNGPIAGGHAILIRAVKIVWTEAGKSVPARERGWADVDLDKSYVVLRNSWGAEFGDEGDCKMTLRVLGRLLDAQGEAVFAVGRTETPVAA